MKNQEFFLNRDSQMTEGNVTFKQSVAPKTGGACRMENGELRMENGELRMESGEFLAEPSGKAELKIKNPRLSAFKNQLKMDNRKFPVFKLVNSSTGIKQMVRWNYNIPIIKTMKPAVETSHIAVETDNYPSLRSTNQFKKLVAMVALMVMMTANVWSQTQWSGTVELTNGQTISGTIWLLSSVTVNVPSGTATISANIQNHPNFSTIPYPVTKTGNGKLILTGSNNTYIGPTIVNNGTLQLGNGSINSVPGAVDVVSVVSDAKLRFEPGANQTFPFNIIGAGSVEYKGASSTTELTLSGANTYSGSTTIEAGCMILNNVGVSGRYTGNIVNNGNWIAFNNTSDGTYSGIISGTGKFRKQGSALVILNGINTYTGVTDIYEGTLAIGGNGRIENSSLLQLFSASKFDISAGNKKIKSINCDKNANNEIVLGTRILTIGNDGQADGGGSFAGKITGNGTSIAIAKQGTGTLTLAGTSTYTGRTVITGGTIVFSSLNNFGTSDIQFRYYTNSDPGRLRWASGNTADISSRIIYYNISQRPVFDIGSNNVTFASELPNTSAYITKEGTGTLTFSTAQTYSGYTKIDNGTLTLGANGSIENSNRVVLSSATSKFNISAGNKTIKNIESEFSGAEVNLGSRVLTINGTSSYTFVGFFSGSNGGVTKTGTGTLTLTGSASNTATGTFTLQQGKLIMANRWQGNFQKEAAAELHINGGINIGGTTTLMGGNIYMDITTNPPARMITAGAMNASGTNTLHITASVVTSHMLFQAASGIGSITPYTLDMPGYTASLEATGAQLLLTANITDNVAPSPGGNGNITISGSINTANLTWTAATDNQTPSNQLRYYVYLSSMNNIGTVANCEANGTLLNEGGSININSFEVTDMIVGTYYFNIVVADAVNNKAAYTPKSITLEKPNLTGTVTLSGNPVFGETLTAVIEDLSSDPEIDDLGGITYMWVRNNNPISGAESDTYELNINDIGMRISVVIRAESCQNYLQSAETYPISKATQEAPGAPIEVMKNTTMIYLDEIQGCEFRMNEGAWQQSALFSGLTPGTEYAFQARRIETYTHFASEASETSIIRTNYDGNPPVILSQSLPEGEIGTLYNYMFSAEGDSPMTWSQDGGTLPTGFSIYDNGIILGLPTAAGTFTFTIKVTNSAGSDSKEFTLVITAQGKPVITTYSLPNGNFNELYTQILTAEGITPLTWTKTDGNLPNGLSLYDNGTILGIPTVIGLFTFTVTVTNASGSDSRELSILIVNPGQPIITTTFLPSGNLGELYNQILTASGNTPITWVKINGNLPNGLSLYENGIILGMPTEAGRFDFTVEATNAVGSDTKELSILIVTQGQPVILTESLPNAVINETYTFTLQASGNETIKWTLNSGTMPAGFYLLENGIIFGMPLTLGEYTFTVKATNDVGYDVREFTITIIMPGKPVITTTSLPDGIIDVFYLETLTAEGNTPIVWTVASGNLPDGLELSTEGFISGTPTTAGTFNFTVKATNEVGSATQELTLVISAIGNPVITTTSLPYGYIDEFYLHTLTATGVTPITWAKTDGDLPTGLTLTNTGIISGMPKVNGNFTFTVKAVNEVGSDTKTLTLSVVNVGINEELGIRNDELRVYPNPTKGEITVSARGHDPLSSEVEIFDVFGHCISPAGGGRGWTFPAGNGQSCISPAGGGQGVDFAGGGQGVDSSNPNEITLDISHLPAGVYFLRVNGKTAKIIKN